MWKLLNTCLYSKYLLNFSHPYVIFNISYFDHYCFRHFSSRWGDRWSRDIFCGKNTAHHFSKQIISSSSHGLVLAGETYDANSISKKSSSSENQCEHSKGPKPDEGVSQLQVITFSENTVQDSDMICWILIGRIDDLELVRFCFFAVSFSTTS